jgi:hypothetical protein
MGEAAVITIGNGDQLDAGDLDGGLGIAHALAARADECDLNAVVGGDGARGLGLLWGECV